MFKVNLNRLIDYLHRLEKVPEIENKSITLPTKINIKKLEKTRIAARGLKFADNNECFSTRSCNDIKELLSHRKMIFRKNVHIIYYPVHSRIIQITELYKYGKREQVFKIFRSNFVCWSTYD